MKGTKEVVDRRTIGNMGEAAVCKYLSEHGYKIVCRNYCAKCGEIDIIAEDNEIIAFVEVKTRPRGSMVSGFDAVNNAKRRKIIRTAIDYLSKNGMKLQPRFDVAQVELTERRHPAVPAKLEIADLVYIENAFDTSGMFVVL